MPSDALPEPVGRRPGRDVVVIFFLAFVLLTAFAGVRDVWDPDEGRYASVALDMRRAGDFVTPHEAGMRFVDKPPLLYWMENGAFALAGPTPFAARLPCLVAGAAWCALIALLASRWGAGRRAAWLAATTAATSLAGMGFSRTVSTDMPLAACVLGALVAGHAALRSDRLAPRLALGVAVGLGLLAKGPIAAVVPVVVAVAWILAGAGWRPVVRALLSPTAWIAALAIAAPWYALMERANPGYLRHFLVYEHFRRFAEGGYREAHPFWIYVPLVPLGLLPWTHLLVGARLRGAVDVGGRAPVPAERLAWASFLACLVFFSSSRTRLLTYILPAFPPLFVLIGARLSERLDAGGAAVRRLGWWLFAYAVPLALAGGAIALGLAHRAHVLVNPRLRDLGVPFVLASILPLAAPLLVRFARSARARATVLVLASAALWWGVDLAASRVDVLRSSRALAETLARETSRDDVTVVLDRYPQGVRFYADVDVRIAENPLHPGREHTQREIVEPWATWDGQGHLMSMAELKALWNGPGRVVLVARAVDADVEFPSGRQLGSGLSGAQRMDLVVVENRPRGR